MFDYPKVWINAGNELFFQCPVFDLDRDVKYQGAYQTMTKQGAITVNVSISEVFPFRKSWQLSSQMKAHQCG